MRHEAHLVTMQVVAPFSCAKNLQDLLFLIEWKHLCLLVRQTKKLEIIYNNKFSIFESVFEYSQIQ